MVAASRVLVEESISEKFISAVRSVFEAAGKDLGQDPLLPTTQHGPVVDKLQFDRIMSYIEKGKESSAQLLAGGKRKGTQGCFIEPTLFVNPASDNPIWTEEIFGPVLSVKTFKTEEEAITVANDSPYGLAGKNQTLIEEESLSRSSTDSSVTHVACVYTSDLGRALRVSAALESGGVSINSPYLPELNTPFGGTKQSGQGRELGTHGLYSYLEPQSLHIK